MFNKNRHINFLGKSHAKIRLFCLPHAGGGAFQYYKWASLLNENIQICPIQLPGRENRLDEKPVTSFTEMLEIILPELSPLLAERPFAFFGHSMGSLLSFELSRKLREKNLQLPVHLFCSASRAPQLPNLSRQISDLSDDDFLEHVKEINGIRDDILNQPEFSTIFLPALRADFIACEKYIYEKNEPFNFPVTVFAGLDDDLVSAEEIAAWTYTTTAKCKIFNFHGGHFYISDKLSNVLDIITHSLLY